MLWRDTLGVPEALSRTVASVEGERGSGSALEVLSRTSLRRLLVTGNGAAYYAGLALWAAALRTPLTNVDVVPIPAGLFAGRQVQTGPGDVLLVVSSSGELRDLIEALPDLQVDATLVLTANPGSTLGRAADAVVTTRILAQDAVSHTQAFAANVVALLTLWARLTGDADLTAAVAAAPEWATASIESARTVATEHGDRAATWRGGIAIGAAGTIPAALETALLLREVAAIPTEGLEAREGATTGMYALGPGQGVVGLGAASALTAEALDVCRRTGADVLTLPWPASCPAGLEPIVALAPSVALAGAAGLARGLDIDSPAWAAAYYATARVKGRKSA